MVDKGSRGRHPPRRPSSPHLRSPPPANPGTISGPLGCQVESPPLSTSNSHLAKFNTNYPDMPRSATIHSSPGSTPGPMECPLPPPPHPSQPNSDRFIDPIISMHPLQQSADLQLMSCTLSPLPQRLIPTPFPSVYCVLAFRKLTSWWCSWACTAPLKHSDRPYY